MAKRTKTESPTEDFAAKAAEIAKAKAERPVDDCCDGCECAKPDHSALAGECEAAAVSAARCVETGCFSHAAIRNWAELMLRAAEALRS